MYKRRSGFTVIELVFIVALLASISILFFIQKNDIERTARDSQRKVAINSIYYSLENIYYQKHHYYPRNLSSNTLPSIDPDMFTDPSGVNLGQTSVTINDQIMPVTSDYSYTGLDCDQDTCKSYELRTSLENEDDFVRKSEHQ